MDGKVWFCELKTFVHVVCARVWMNSSELIPYATLYCMRKFLWPCHTYHALPSGKFVLKAAAGLVNHVKSINWYFQEIPCWVKPYITKEMYIFTHSSCNCLKYFETYYIIFLMNFAANQKLSVSESFHQTYPEPQIKHHVFVNYKNGHELY